MSTCVSFGPLQEQQTQQCFAIAEDGGLFAVGTNQGFVIYSLEPFAPISIREVADGGVHLLSMFARSNLLLLVCPQKPKTALLWDETRNPAGPVAQLELPGRRNIMAVRLHHQFLVVADTHEVFVFSQRLTCVFSREYHSESRKLGLPALAVGGKNVCMDFYSVFASNQNNNINNNSNETTTTAGGAGVGAGGAGATSSASFASNHSFNTNNNNSTASLGGFDASRGVMSSRRLTFPIAIPSTRRTGSLLVVHLDAATGSTTGPHAGGPQSAHFAGGRQSAPAAPLEVEVHCHNQAVGCSTFSSNGKFIVTCSVGGSAIKLSDARSGAILMQFNRGRTRNEIHSLAVSSDMKYFSCVSHSGSVHIFGFVDALQRDLEGLAGDESVAPGNPRLPPGMRDRSLGGPSATGAAGVIGSIVNAVHGAVEFESGGRSCGEFNLRELHPLEGDGSARSALFGHAIVGFVEQRDDDGSTFFVVANAESGTVGKVRFRQESDVVMQQNQQYQSQNQQQQQQNNQQGSGADVMAAGVIATRGGCTLQKTWQFPGDVFW